MSVRVLRTTVTLLIALPLESALAQGVTGAALNGVVVTSDGKAVAGAAITLINSSSGTAMRSISRNRGEFGFDNVPVGGPYRIVARSIGFEPTAIEGITLHLGDRLVRNVVLTGQAARELTTVLIRDSNLRDAGAG